MSRRLPVSLALLLLVLGGGRSVAAPGDLWARREVRRLTIATWPPRVSVFAQTSRGSQYLGSTDRPVDVPIDPDHRGSTFLLLQADGYATRSLIIPPESGATPASGPVHLVPLSPWSDVCSLWDLYGTTVMSVLAVVLAAFCLLAWPRLRRRREKLERAGRLDRLIGASEGTDRLVGRRLGRYRIAARMGEGGMATLYRAVPDETLAEADSVALKVMRPEMFKDDEVRQRFRREVQILRELDHPCIARVIDWGDQDGLLYLVLELVTGTSLRSFVVAGGQPLDRAMQLLRPVFQACSYVHGRGVVHRNLKPENIVHVPPGERVKIIDFGLARGRHSLKITLPGQILGTPVYMAPEQVTGGEVGLPADQYALGLITYELLTGEKAFYARSRLTTMFLHVSQKHRPLRELRPDLPAAVEAVVERLLAKKPEDRFKSVDEALAALEKACTQVD